MKLTVFMQQKIELSRDIVSGTVFRQGLNADSIPCIFSQIESGQ